MGERPCKTVTSISIHLSVNMLHICSRIPFLEIETIFRVETTLQENV